MTWASGAVVSYDLTLINAKTLQEADDGAPLGTTADVTGALCEAFEGRMEWAIDEGYLIGGPYYLEVSLEPASEEDMVRAVHIVAKGDLTTLPDRLARLCRARGWRVSDPQCGDWNLDQPPELQNVSFWRALWNAVRGR